MEPSGIYIEKSKKGNMLNVQKGYGFTSSDTSAESDRRDEDRRTQTSTFTSSSRRVKVNTDNMPGSVTTVYHQNATDMFTTMPYPSVTYPRVIITTESSNSFTGGSSISGVRIHETSLDGSQTQHPWRHHTGYDNTRANHGFYDSSTEVYVGSTKESNSRYDDRLEKQKIMEQKFIEEQIAERNRIEAERKLKETERRIQLMAQREEERRRKQQERERNREGKNLFCIIVLLELF